MGEITITDSYAYIKKQTFLTIKSLVLLSLIFSLADVANASVTYSNDVITIKDTDKVNNISTLYSSLVQTYGENYTNENLLTESSPKKWICKKKISVLNQNDNFWINDTDVEELKIDRNKIYEESLVGYIELRNVKIISWNSTENRPYTFAEHGGKIISYKEAHNVEFNNCYIVCFGYQYGNGIKDLSYTNLSLNNMAKGLSFQNATNITINNITIRDGDPIYGGGLVSCKMNDSSLSNITVINASDYIHPATGAYGIQLKGINNTIQDIYINGTAWSSFLVSGNNFTTYNATIINSGHNGFESETDDSYFENMTVSNSTAINFFQIGHQNQGTPSINNIYKDIRSINHSTCGMYISVGTCNLTVINAILENRGFEILDSNNITLINCTQTNGSTGCLISKFLFNKPETFYYSEDHRVIDSSFTNNGYRDIWVNYGNNTKIVNSKYNSYRVDNGKLEAYYYVDILTRNSSGMPIGNISVSIENEYYPMIGAVNGYGEEMTVFPIEEGRSYLPTNNRAESPAIAEFYKDKNNTYCPLSHTVTVAAPGNRTVSLSGITPDSSWYRKDPNIPTYTITAIIPNTSSKGPDIIGFAPSEDNPFNPGDKKNFRVWTDEPLTSMEWRVNGSSVLKGSLNYTWTVTDNNTTIEFIGSNANGPVNMTWQLGESSEEPSVPGGNPTQEIKFSPADSILTRNVSETVDFSVSPDIFTTKEWYINGNLALKNTTSMSKNWSTAGTYNVTFSGSGNSRNVSHTWTVNVIETEPEPQNVSIASVTPEYQVITPGKQFDLNISVDPEIAISGAQLDFVFNSSMASANSVAEGDLLKQSGAYTIFSRGIIDNSAGTAKNIYGFILGTSSVSSPGAMATVNMTAGNRTGITEFSLSNVIISDANSKSVPYTVTNATLLIDTAPIMNPICSPRSVDENNTLVFKVIAKDADGDRLKLSASGLPVGASFNKTSGTFTWTPAIGQAGVYTLIFEVSDGYLTDSENITITVNKLNNLPVINFFEPLNESSFSEGERIEISVNASDSDGQTLTYLIRIDGVTHSTDPTYIWETDYSASGNHTIEVVVSDGTEEVKEQRIIYINECHPRWDVNEDGVVNILDVTSVSQMVGSTLSKPYPRYDVNQDGLVNIQDLTLVGSHFGEIVN